jgi:hypothetical protein
MGRERRRKPRKLDLDKIRAILESGSLDELKGTVEDARLECKAQPYKLTTDRQKQELAKDVSGLANAAGGIIVIGAKTRKRATHLGDEIVEVRPFGAGLVNVQQYHDILSGWVYPQLHGVSVKWYRSSSDASKGIMAIQVPEQASGRGPFLVTRTVDNEDKLSTVVFGYFERMRASVEARSVEELQALLRDGVRYDRVSEFYEDIQATLAQISAQRPGGAEQPSGLEKALDERIENALTEAGLQSAPAFVLAALPIQKVEIRGLFESRSAPVVCWLEHPPKLRELSFGLECGERARIVRGQMRRVATAGYKSLELWRDGTLIFVATAGNDFLSWASPKRGPQRLNPVVLAESTYLFAELSRLVFEHAEPQPEKIEYRVELRGMAGHGGPLVLIPGPVGTFDWRSGHRKYDPPEPELRRTHASPLSDLRPGAVAFSLLVEVYRWYGIEDRQIPYAEQVGESFEVSAAKIRDIA